MKLRFLIRSLQQIEDTLGQDKEIYLLDRHGCLRGEGFELSESYDVLYIEGSGYLPSEKEKILGKTSSLD